MDHVSPNSANHYISRKLVEAFTTSSTVVTYTMEGESRFCQVTWEYLSD